MRTKHWSHPLEDSPGVAPEIEPLGPPIPDEPFKVKPQRADFPIGKIGTSDAALDNFLDAVMAFDERERIILYRDPTTDGLQLRLGRHRATWLFYWDDPASSPPQDHQQATGLLSGHAYRGSSRRRASRTRQGRGR